MSYVQHNEPPRVAVVKAINRFIDAPVREKHGLLERNHALLLSNTAEQMLATRIGQTQESSDTQQVITLKLHQWILRKARESGIAAAREELTYLTEPHIRSSLFIFLDCLRHATARARLQALEAHLELLDPTIDSGLAANIAFAEESTHQILALGPSTGEEGSERMQNTVQAMRDHLEVLRDARRHGGTIEALREAYVNVFGGRALQVPSWFAELEAPLVALESQGPSEEASAERIRLLGNLLQHAQHSSEIAPETLAELYLELAETRVYQIRYLNDLEGYERILADAHKALEVYTRTRYPRHFAFLQKYLGNAYAKRSKALRKDNLEQAIACYQAALEVFSKETAPRTWAEIELDLALAYGERIEGSAKENAEKTLQHATNALLVFTRESFPTEWASAQHALGNVYLFRVDGLRKDNLERAIMHYNATLQETTFENSPHEWAVVQYSLGNCYLERIEGNPRDNIEQAIAHFRAALIVHTREAFPDNWVLDQMGLGLAYVKRSTGMQKENVEQAISHLKAAIELLSPRTHPREWDALHHNLALAYWKRIEGAPIENIELALETLTTSARALKREEDPFSWARNQFNLANLYRDRVEGDRGENLLRAEELLHEAEQVFTETAFPREWAMLQEHLGNVATYRDEMEAISYYVAALRYYTREHFPYEWSGLQHNLGIAYRDCPAGDRRENLERAIACFQAALQVRTHSEYPQEWAATLYSLGITYEQRIEGKHKQNIQIAIEYFKRVLAVYTLEADPHEHRTVQLRLGNVEAERGNWEEAHHAFASAYAAETVLVQLGAGAMGRDIILRGRYDAATRDGYALLCLGRPVEAAIAVEQGRARDLAEALALFEAEPDTIRDPERRKRFQEARQRFIASQALLNRPVSMLETAFKAPDIQVFPEDAQRRANLERSEAYHEAVRDFEAIMAEIRAAGDPPSFLNAKVDVTMLLRAVARGGPGHALVYLLATPWGGKALTVLHAEGHRDINSRFLVLDLPPLSEQRINDLLDTRLDNETRAVIGGFAYAQEYRGLALLGEWANQGRTFREVAGALHKACQQVGKESTLDAAAQEALHDLEFASLVDTPLDTLVDEAIKREVDRMAHQFWLAFLRHELQRCFPILKDIALAPLIATLREWGVTSLTLVPCGTLAAFPLSNILLDAGHTVSETIPTSVAPSARALLQSTSGNLQRAGVYTLGNPQPWSAPLRWSETEALALAKLARRFNCDGYAKVQMAATRNWLVEALGKGYVVDASCHGRFDRDDFRNSVLVLAKDQELSLGELLSHQIDLRGLRLLILSACQTMLLDLRGAVNQVRSLASGVLQSGAQATLGSLWPVNDLATYLLMARFAQEWFPQMNTEPPAFALARAQRWLRTVTNHELSRWGETRVSILPQQERLEEGESRVEGSIAGNLILEALGVSSERYDSSEASWLIRIMAVRKDEPVKQPFQDPFCWAGFQITGW